MLVVAIVVIFAFAVMPNRTNTYIPGQGLVVDGEVYDEQQQSAISTGLQLAGSLGGDPQMKIAYGLSRLPPVMMDMDGNPLPQNTLANVILLRKLAKEVGVEVTDTEVDAYIRTLQPFQTDGSFDSNKWTDRMQMMGIAKEGEKGDDKGSVLRSRLYAGLRDALLLDKVAELTGAPLAPTDAQVDWEYWRDNQETTVLTATFSPEEFADVEVTEEEIQAYFDENKNSAALMTEEQRALRYALLPLPARPVAPNTATLPAEEQVSKQAEYQEQQDAFEARKKKIDTAASRLADLMVMEDRDPARETFESLVEQSFAHAREKFAEEAGMDVENHELDAGGEGGDDVEGEGGEETAAAEEGESETPAADILQTPEVKVTGLFAASDPPEELKDAAQFLSTVFSRRLITEADKIGDAVTTPAGYYFYEIAEVKEPAEQSLDAVRDKIVAALKETKAADALNTAVTEYREKVSAALAEGKAFEVASEEAGKTPEQLPAFSVLEPIKSGLTAQLVMDAANGRPENPNPQYYQAKIAPTNTGTLSEAFDTPGGGKLLVYVAKRELPEDPAKVGEAKASMRTRLAARSGTSHFNGIFQAWFQQKKKEMFAPEENGLGAASGG